MATCFILTGYLLPSHSISAKLGFVWFAFFFVWFVYFWFWFFLDFFFFLKDLLEITALLVQLLGSS